MGANCVRDKDLSFGEDTYVICGPALTKKRKIVFRLLTFFLLINGDHMLKKFSETIQA